jgi:uncharacterized membrane protein
MERPVMRVPKVKLDWAFEIITFLCISWTWIYCFISYSTLPDNIPVHYNELGFPNGYGSKDTLWLIPCIVTVVVIALFFLNKYPHLFNYTVNITEQNAFKQYKMSTRLLRIISMNVAALFSYIVYKEVEGATTGYSRLDWWFIPLLLASIITPTIWTIISSSKK